MRRLLLVSYPFPPSAVVGALRPLRMARHLPDFGYEVEVLTTGIGEGERDFDMQLLHAVPERTVVHRVPVRHFLKRDPWRQPPRSQPLHRAWWKARSYATHVLGPLDWFAPWAHDARRYAEGLLRTRRFDAVVVTAPPFSSLVECAPLRRATGVPLVLDLRDLWTARFVDVDEARGYGTRSGRGRRARRLEAAAIELSDRVILTSADAAALQARAFPQVPSATFVCVPNAYDNTQDAGSDASCVRDDAKPVTLIHTGTLAAGRAKAAENLLRAAALLERESPNAVRVLFVGAGEPGLVPRLAASAGATDVTSEEPWVPRERTLQLQEQSDVLVVLQSGTAEGRSAVPAKLYEYMAVHRWMLGVVPEGPAARIMREEWLGEVAPWDDPDAIAVALRAIIRRVRSAEPPPPPSPRYAARETMRQLAGVLDDLLGTHTGTDTGTHAGTHTAT